MADRSPLVSTAWLADHLDDADVVVLDCRWYLKPFDERDALAEYTAGHIPGARHVSWDRELADPERGALNMLASAGRFAEAMGQLGVGDDTTVVTYDDHHVPVASRVWWALQVYGHEAVYVLDGGISAWRSEGRPIDTGPAPPRVDPPATFTPRRRDDLYATKQDVLDALEHGGTTVVDARMDVAYAAASGHIPGSVRVTGLGFLGDGEHWMTPDAARERIQAAGAAGDDVVLYCGGGVAATGALVGWRLAGSGGRVRVYDGSWTEWSQDQETPKENH